MCLSLGSPWDVKNFKQFRLAESFGVEGFEFETAAEGVEFRV